RIDSHRIPAGTDERSCEQSSGAALEEAAEASRAAPTPASPADSSALWPAGSLVAVAGLSLCGDWRRRRSGSTLTERGVERY
ncbi:MAG: hypothetical protein ACKO3P_02315, partial [Planctomycetaceae bacterium]